MAPSRSELPLAETPREERAERADAARNRRRILDAAADVFAGRSAATVSMDDLAKAAGVGRATLYRRFPSVGAVAEALLDDHERAVQEHILTGPPPLGPGAPPGERLTAFYAAMVELLDRHANLVLGTEVGQQRFQTGAYRFWRAHVLHLLTEGGADDPETLADLALAPLDPSVFLDLRQRGVGADRIHLALQRLAEGVLPGH